MWVYMADVKTEKLKNFENTSKSIPTLPKALSLSSSTILFQEYLKIILPNEELRQQHSIQSMLLCNSSGQKPEVLIHSKRKSVYSRLSAYMKWPCLDQCNFTCISRKHYIQVDI